MGEEAGDSAAFDQASAYRRTIPSEDPLRLFVSSVMRPETEGARDVCFRVLSTGIYKVWMWEHTPASSDKPRDVYLAAVEASELVIWLVGSETSAPVQAEIELAIRLGRPLLVFLLPVAARDDLTQQLMRDARGVIKTTDVVDLVDLERQLTQSLDDILLRAFRGNPRLERRAAAQALHGRLRGIALTRWLAAGVPLNAAAVLFDDPTVGRLPDELLPANARPLRVLRGDVGSGKTLGAVRWLLEATRRVIDDPAAPLPVWVGREDQADDLRSAVAEQTHGMGDPRLAGVALVLDGLDERTDEPPKALLEAARALVYSHPQSRGLVTLRPGLLAREHVSELADIPLLSPDDTAALINRVFAVRIRPFDIQSSERPIRDAVRLPLFALLLGRIRSESPFVRVRGVGQLIERLVVSALGANLADAPASVPLMTLARESIDADGRPVPTRDLGDRRAADGLLSSRLVAPSGDALGFALPILREWFGAQSIEQGVTSVDHIVASELRVERWRYALYVAAATLPRATVNTLLAAVSSRSPGLASRVIEEASSAWGPDGDSAPPSAVNLGRWYLQAMDGLSLAVGSAGKVVFPRSSQRQLPLLAVAGDERRFQYAWLRREPEDDRDVVEMPLNDIEHPPEGYLRAHYTAPSSDPIWPWKAARDELRGELTAAVKARAFFVDPMGAEAAWLAATWLVRGGSVFGAPIPAEAVREALALHRGDAVRVRDRVVPLFPLRQVLEHATEISGPYPDRDEELSGWVWSGFSDAVLLKRTRLVYEVAVAIYDALVREWFDGLRPRLRLAQLLPARLVGILHPGRRGPGAERYDSGPGISYRWEPLPRGATSRIEIELGENRGPDWTELDGLRDRIRALRPEVPWLESSATYGGLLMMFDHDAATSLAYDWLHDELRDLNWST